MGATFKDTTIIIDVGKKMSVNQVGTTTTGRFVVESEKDTTVILKFGNDSYEFFIEENDIYGEVISLREQASSFDDRIYFTKIKK